MMKRSPHAFGGVSPANVSAATVLAIATLVLASTAHAEVLVTQTNIIRTVVISPTVTQYTAQLRVKNDGPATSATRIVATAASKGVELRDRRVNVGALAARETAFTADTITWRQSGKGKARFDWNVQSRTPRVLRGFARTGAATAFAGAEVVATVSHTNAGGVAARWGKPLVEQFTAAATTGTDGAYSIKLETLADSDFITLQAIGSGGVDLLGGVIGEAGALARAAGKFSTAVDSTRWPRLQLTPVSTAAWGAGVQAHLDIVQAAGELDSESEWAAARLRSDNAGLLQRAVTIKMLIENPSWPRNAGFVDMFDVAARDSAAQTAFDLVRANGSAAYSSAVQELIASFDVPFNAAALGGTTLWSYAGDARTNVGGFGASTLEFNADGTGSARNFDRMLPMTWQVQPSGRLLLNYSDTQPIVGLADVFEGPGGYPCPVPPSGQVEVHYYAVDEEFAQVYADAGTAELMPTHRTTRNEFPDCPAANTTTAEILFSPIAVRMAVGTLPSQPFASAELAGRVLASYVLMPGVAGAPAGFGQDGQFASLLQFNANGTGLAIRGNLAFTWQIEPTSGDLVLTYENGYVNTIHRLHAPVNGVHATLLSGEGAGFGMLARNQLIERDGALIVPGASGLRLRLGIGEEQNLITPPTPNQLQLEWIAVSGGTGCRVQVQDTGTVFIPATWTSPAGRIDFDYFSRVGGGYSGSRYYEPIRYLPKRTLDDLSTGGYASFENLQFLGDPPYDTATEPARFQFVREIGPATSCSN